MRVEHDFLGDKDIPSDALYGIHAVRAVENFPDNTRFHAEWYRAVGLTKLACYLTYQSFKKATIESYSSNKIPFPLMDDKVVEALIAAAEEVSEGKHFEHFIVPAVQGGAGTSINMSPATTLAG